MSNGKNGNGMYKMAAGMLASVLVSVLGSWLAFGGGITAMAAKEITAAQVDPVKKNQGELREWLKSLATRHQESREEMIDRLGRIETEQKANRTILERLDRRP